MNLKTHKIHLKRSVLYSMCAVGIIMYLWMYNTSTTAKFIPKVKKQNTHLGFPGGSVVKNLPAMQETQVWSLIWADSTGQGAIQPTHHSC